MSEAVELLTSYGEKAHLLAGGTDVLGKLKERELAQEILVDVIRGDCRGLSTIPAKG